MPPQSQGVLIPFVARRALAAPSRPRSARSTEASRAIAHGRSVIVPYGSTGPETGTILPASTATALALAAALAANLAFLFGRWEASLRVAHYALVVAAATQMVVLLSPRSEAPPTRKGAAKRPSQFVPWLLDLALALLVGWAAFTRVTGWPQLANGLALQLAAGWLWTMGFALGPYFGGIAALSIAAPSASADRSLSARERCTR